MSGLYGYVLLWLFERRLKKVAGKQPFHFKGRDFEIWGSPR